MSWKKIYKITKIFFWWSLFMLIYFGFYLAIIYNGGSVPKLAKGKEPPRFLTDIINRPEQGIPYYFGDSALVALSGPKCCLPGGGYSSLEEKVDLIPKVDFPFDIIVVSVIDHRAAWRKGEIEAPDAHKPLKKALLKAFPNSRVFVVPPSRIRAAALIYNLGNDDWHPSPEGFRLLQKEFPQYFPEDAFYSSNRRKVKAAFRPILGFIGALRAKLSQDVLVS